MSTFRSKDRASLCSFTFADGRQHRTPRYPVTVSLLLSCRKEAQAQPANSIGHGICPAATSPPAIAAVTAASK